MSVLSAALSTSCGARNWWPCVKVPVWSSIERIWTACLMISKTLQLVVLA